MKIAFYYNAQFHQVPHSLPFALELAAAYPGVQVDILAPTQGHLDFAARLARLWPEAKVGYRLLDLPAPLALWQKARPVTVPAKVPVLWHNRRVFDEYDALVVTEKTSLLLRRFGVRRPKIIHTAHGAGDRATAVDPRIARFDFALVPGPKTARWLLELGHIRPGAYAVGAYAKFDVIRRLGKERERLFANGRPTVLYNPHFRPALSSWPDWGHKVLEQFAASDRYNLIFAPHVRLFDPPTPAKYKAFEAYRSCPHMLIDLGSDRSVDMTYTLAADAYLGDVSSQVYEFLVNPRPCAFLNAHGVEWRGNARYLFWTLGPVADDPADVIGLMDRAFAEQPRNRSAQDAAVRATFDLSHESAGRAGADAIMAFLQGRPLPVEPELEREPEPMAAAAE